MGRITDTLFRNWMNGETVTAQDYKKEHEIIKVAINDNDDRIRLLEGVALGQIRQVPNGNVPPSNPSPAYVFYNLEEDLFYILKSDGQWEAVSPKGIVDTHIGNNENPHNTTAAQVGAYTKTETDGKFYTKLDADKTFYNKTDADKKFADAAGQRIENFNALFFTNGGSQSSTATVTFGKPFAKPPVVIPGNVVDSVPYIDTIGHPFIVATTTGCTIKIMTDGTGNLGTLNSPKNAVMSFIVMGE